VIQGFAAGGPMGGLTAIIGEAITQLKIAYDTFVDFETALVRVSSATDLTGEELAQLEEQLKEAAMAAGEEFGVGATKAMEALESLVKAGLEGEDAIEALNAALALAQIEGIEAAEASDMLVGILGMYQMSAEEAAHATDVLANASIQGIATASEFAHGLQFVGGRAQSLGFSLEETTAVLVAMNNAGINATSAGRYLNEMFSAMIKKSDQLGFSIYDASGNMLSLAEISGNLVERLNEFSTAEERNTYLTEIFGNRAGRAALTLMSLGESGEEVTAAFEDMVGEMGESGTAMNVMGEIMDTTAGKQAKLQAAIENLQITMGEELADSAEFFADFMEDTLIPLLNDIIPPIMAIVTGFMDFIKFVINLAKVISHTLQPHIDSFLDAIRPIVDGVEAIGAAISSFASGVVNDINRMGEALDEDVGSLEDSVGEFKTGYEEVAEDIVDANEEIIDSMEELTDSATDEWNTLIDDTNSLIEQGLLGDAQKKIHDFVDCSLTKQADMVEDIDKYLKDLQEDYAENEDKIAQLVAQGKNQEAELIRRKNEEIMMKMQQLNAWRSQLIGESMADSLNMIGQVKQAVREIEVTLKPPPTVAAEGPMTNYIDMNFDKAITDLDAERLAKDFLMHVDRLREERQRQRWKAHGM
jgi:TP901 family phage tail tape measure protein